MLTIANSVNFKCDCDTFFGGMGLMATHRDRSTIEKHFYFQFFYDMERLMQAVRFGVLGEGGELDAALCYRKPFKP